MRERRRRARYLRTGSRLRTFPPHHVLRVFLSPLCEYRVAESVAVSRLGGPPTRSPRMRSGKCRSQISNFSRQAKGRRLAPFVLHPAALVRPFCPVTLAESVSTTANQTDHKSGGKESRAQESRWDASTLVRAAREKMEGCRSRSGLPVVGVAFSPSRVWGIWRWGEGSRARAFVRLEDWCSSPGGDRGGSGVIVAGGAHRKMLLARWAVGSRTAST